MVSTGFNSGARAGSSTSVRLSGTTRSLARCHPARSISMTPWAPGATACATSAKCRLMACVSHRERLWVLGIVTRASRELAIAERTQFPAQRRLAERDPKLHPDPHCEILQPPAHHAVDRRHRPNLDNVH